MGDLLAEVRASRSFPGPDKARAIRRSAGVSRERLAQELQVHPTTITRWETGLRCPRGEMRARYANLLNALADECQ